MFDDHIDADADGDEKQKNEKVLKNTWSSFPLCLVFAFLRPKTEKIPSGKIKSSTW